MNDESMAQGSAEWLFARVGHCTASKFGSVMAKLKSGKPAKERDDYLWQLVIERLTGQPSDNFVSAAMQRGTDTEPRARMAYEARTGALVEETGFAHHPEIELVGASCDGLIGTDGMIEIKCPWNSAIHLRTVLDGMPEEHAAQVQGCLWVTGRAWADFISYDDRMPEPLDLYVQRIRRDEAYIEALDAEVRAFLVSVEAMTETLRGMVKAEVPAQPAEPMAWPEEHPADPAREEAHTLAGIENAIDGEMAAIVLDMAAGRPWHAKAEAAFNARWTQPD